MNNEESGLRVEEIEKCFERLKEECFVAYALICEAAVYRSAVPQDWWLSHLEDSPWNCNAERQRMALDELRDRHLIEEEIVQDKLHLSLNPLVRSVALNHLESLTYSSA
jgi:hypothetical protein